MAPQVALQRITESDETEVLREQLDYLIDHAASHPQCGCAACQRYLRVRAALLEIFTKPPRANVQEITLHLAKAA